MFDYYKLVVLLILCLNLSCNSQVKNTSEKTFPNASENVSPPSNLSSGNIVENLPTQTNTPVNSVNFENFAFPVCPKVLKKSLSQLKSIKLKDGELVEKEKVPSSNIEHEIIFSLLNVSYYDLTNDNHLDAVVTIGIKYFQGADNCTFIYSLSDKKPKLIWTHEYENGIRKIAFEQGGLLIEQYNNSLAVCCPTAYSRLLFNWDGKSFIQTKSEIIPNKTKEKNFLGFPNKAGF